MFLQHSYMEKQKRKFMLLLEKNLGNIRVKECLLMKVYIHDELSSTLRRLGFVPSKADYNLWMRKKDDHYEYITMWVDDLLVFSKNPMKIIDRVKEIYDLKGVGSPEY